MPTSHPRWRLPLRSLLVLPLLTVVGLGIGGVGSLVWWSSREAVLSLAEDLNRSINAHVESQFKAYLGVSLQLNLLNQEAIQSGILPLPNEITEIDLEIWEAYFRRQIDRYPQVDYLGFATYLGGGIAVGRDSGETVLGYRTETAAAGRVFLTQFGEQVGEIVSVELMNFSYDARERAWFQNVIGAESMSRSVTFDSLLTESRHLIITGLPVRNNADDLLGVLIAVRSLRHLESLIQDLDQDHPGYSFIIDNRGRVILGSGSHLASVQGTNGIIPLRSAAQSEDPILQAIGQEIMRVETLSDEQSFVLKIDQEEYLVEVESLEDLLSLNWYLVRGIPVSEVLETVNQTAWRSVALGLGIGAIILILIGLIADVITKPIRSLSRQAETLTNNPYQQWDPSFSFSVGPIKELQVLSQSLRKMIVLRQQALIEIRDQELFFRAILDSQTELIIRYDTNTRIKFVNQSYANFFNRNANTLVGKSWIENLPQPQRDDLLTKLQQLTPIHPINLAERWYVELDGSQRWLSWVDQGIFDDSGELVEILSVGRDITERKQMEAELEQIAHQKDQLLQEIQYLNTELSVQVEIRTAELKEALDFAAMLHRIGTQLVTSLDEAEILNLVVQEMVQTLGSLSCVIGFFSEDISRYEPRYECSPHLPSCLGRVYLAEESGHHVWSQYHLGIYAHRCSFEPEDGRWITLLNCPIMDEGELLGLISVDCDADRAFRDPEIDLVQQVANLCALGIRQAHLYKAAQMQVVELERLNILKDDFISTVSHELRTPLSNLRMALSMLSRSTDEEKRQRFCALAIEECDRQAHLVNDLLDMQRLELDGYSLNLQPIDIMPYLASFDQEIRSHTDVKKQDWRIFYTSDLTNPGDPTSQIILWTDATCLSRILRELAHNAIKYTAPEGQIQLSISPNPKGILFTCSNSTEIPSDELNRIFDKFYRIPQFDRWKHGGTGLGLALVKQLIVQMQGHISVDSSQDWTHFRVWIPSLEAKSSSPSHF